jgi:predicted component of type VI protein secretion system
MHPMNSVTLVHAHHAEAHRLAGLRHHGRARHLRSPQIARREAPTPTTRPETAPTGLRALLRSAAEVPQRLATTFRPAA